MQNAQTDYYWWQGNATDIVRQLGGGNGDEGDRNWTTHPMWRTIYRNLYLYFSSIIDPADFHTGLVFTGNQSELVKMYVPLARSLIRQLVLLQTKERLVFQPIADTKGQEVLEATRLAKAICNDLVRTQNLNAVYAQAVEHQYITGLGILSAHWRTDKGEYFGDDEQGARHYTGENEIWAPTIWDLRFDDRITDPNKWQWVRVRQAHNRWDLIAQFPDLYDQILELPSISRTRGAMSRTFDRASEEDLVYVYCCYHIVSPSMPEGRMVVYGSEECIFVDGPNYYKTLPIFISRNEPIPGQSWGYPFFSMLVPLQEMLDASLSSMATNIDAFATQTVAAPKGSDVVPTQIFGMNWFEYTPVAGAPNGGAPHAIQLTAVSEHNYKFTEIMQNYLMELSFINSAMRGNPPEGVTSGTAFATLTATALETIHATGISARDMLRNTMRQAIRNLKTFASAERPISMDMGRGTYMSTYTGEMLDPVKDIEITEVNPLMQTVSGRMEIAKDLLAMGALDKKAYFAILQGAPSEVMYELELSEEDLVKTENEMMANGEMPEVVGTDDDPYHIMMHKISLNTQKIRKDPKLLQIHLQHIMQHWQNSLTKSPELAAMLKTGVAPLPPPPGMMGGPPMLPGNEGPDSKGPNGPGQAEQKGGTSPQAKPQKDPVSGQRSA